MLNILKYFSEWTQVRDYGGGSPVTYDQYSLIRASYPVHTLRTGIDWFISPKQTVGFLFNRTYTNRDGDIDAKADIMQIGTLKVESIEEAESEFKNKYNSQMYNINYRISIAEDEELTVDADYGHVYSNNWQNMQISYLNTDGNVLRLPAEFQYRGPRSIDILSLKADYMKSFSEITRMEAGLKTGQTITDNEILYENLNDGRWEVDYNQSNNFKYTEQVSAVYATFSHRFGKFSAMAGLRAEYTSIKGESPTMDTTFSRSYIDWFPSTFLQYQIKDGQSLNLSYSRKINRPGFGLLNPFRTYIDPFTFFSGNPDLKPSYNNTVSLRYSINGYSANLSYSFLNDIFEQDYEQDDETRTMNVTTNNLGKRQGLTLSGYIPIKFAKWYNMQIYAQGMWNMDDTRHSGERFRNDYLTAYTSLQNVFTITSTLRANIQMIWNKLGWQGIMLFDDIYSMNAQLEKTFFDKRLSVSISCNDLFSSTVYRAKVDFANMNQKTKQDNHYRQIILTARYSFGSQQIRGARNRSVGIEEEIGRTR